MKPCQYRDALEDGRIICRKISEGNPEVNPNICRLCPAMAINCEHLRLTLRKVGHKPILVRFGNGKTDVWNDDPPAVEFVNGACAEKVMPISDAHDCVGCQVRCPIRRERVVERKPAVRQPAVASGSNVIMFPAAGPQKPAPAGSAGGMQAQRSAAAP